jgi:Ca2+/Na+ antiporter
MGFFIEPSSLPGGRAWAAACAAAAGAGVGGKVPGALECAEGGLGGLVQVLTLLAVYGFVLYTASGLIAEGSELLLLVPSLRGIVGSVVLPVLGAIPDGCIVFFSGLGDNAQEEIAVGVGALAGSTSMLLTVPWFLSVLAGRVNVRPDGTANYARLHGRGRWAKLMPPGNASLRGTGVEPMPMVAISGRIMAVTATTYVVIQLAAFSTGNFFAGAQTRASTAAAAAAEQMPAALCFLVSMAFFVGYLVYQLTSSSEEEVAFREIRADSVCQKAIRHGDISLSTAFEGIWEAAEAVDESVGMLVEQHKKDRLRSLLKIFFRHYDVDNDGTISSQELHSLMLDLGEHPTAAGLADLVKRMDADESGTIDFNEFVTAMPGYIRGVSAGAGARSPAAAAAATPPPLAAEDGGNGGSAGEADDEEEEDVPHDLRHDDPKTQLRNIMRRSFAMMLTGTALVLVFSDPMVDVLGDVGARIGVAPFYISFILAPLASNASELFAAYQYATKKTRKTVTISFSTLLGAAILNNTFVLAIFMALIYLKGLAWNFTAETISILFVELVMLHFSQKRVQTLRDGYIILALFPLSLVIVMVLENVFGLD